MPAAAPSQILGSLLAVVPAVALSQVAAPPAAQVLAGSLPVGPAELAVVAAAESAHGGGAAAGPVVTALLMLAVLPAGVYQPAVEEPVAVKLVLPETVPFPLWFVRLPCFHTHKH